MSDDVLRRVSWPAGELFLHGSEKHVKQITAEFLLSRMKVELARKLLGDGDGTRTSTAKSDE